jgi:flagellar biosynthetic protein FliR
LHRPCCSPFPRFARVPVVLLPENLDQFLLVFGLGAARTIPLVWSVPAFGGPTLPAQVRLVLGIALSALCFPILSAHPPVGGDLFWMLLAGREVVVGTAMGFVCSCVFRAAEAAGQLTDVLRGANLAEAISPVGAGRSSPLGILMLLLFVVVFHRIGGVGMIAVALARSYDAIPLIAPLPFGKTTHAMAILAVVASGKLIESAIGLCAPAVVALLLADIVLGALGRSAPQIPLYFVGMPLKALLGVGAVLIGLATLDVTMQQTFQGFLSLFEAAARLGR